MYSVLPSFVLGFHGCDHEIAERVFSGKCHLKASTNDWDWLGNGIYFWENNPQRALSYAESLMKHPERRKGKMTKPAVVGAIIDLGYCLNLLDEKSIHLVSEANLIYEGLCEFKGVAFAKNKIKDESGNSLVRVRDCSVIETLHAYRSEHSKPNFDSVRGMFTEGSPLYENAGFHRKNHIQLCIRNPNCIKGYFRGLDPDANWMIP